MAHRAPRAVVLLQVAPLPMTKAVPLVPLVQAKAPVPVLLLARAPLLVRVQVVLLLMVVVVQVLARP